MGDTTTSGSKDGGSFWDLGLKDLVGTAVDVYDKEKTRSRVGSGGDQSQTATVSNPPPPATVNERDYEALQLPPWAVTLLAVSVVVLVGAIAWKAVR